MHTHTFRWRFFSKKQSSKSSLKKDLAMSKGAGGVSKAYLIEVQS